MRCHTSAVTATGTITPASLQRSAGSSTRTPSRRASARLYWWITSPKRERRVSPWVTGPAPLQRSRGSYPGPGLPMRDRRARSRSTSWQPRPGSPGRGPPRSSRALHHTRRQGNGYTATSCRSRSTIRRCEDNRGPPRPAGSGRRSSGPGCSGPGPIRRPREMRYPAPVGGVFPSPRVQPVAAASCRSFVRLPAGYTELFLASCGTFDRVPAAFKRVLVAVLAGVEVVLVHLVHPLEYLRLKVPGDLHLASELLRISHLPGLHRGMEIPGHILDSPAGLAGEGYPRPCHHQDHLLIGRHGHTSIRSIIPRCSRWHPAGPVTCQSLPRLISCVSSYPAPMIPNPAPKRDRHPGRERTSPPAMVIFTISPPALGEDRCARRSDPASWHRPGRHPSPLSLPAPGRLRRCHLPWCGGPGPRIPAGQPAAPVQPPAPAGG